jgi:hypothetical protein
MCVSEESDLPVSSLKATLKYSTTCSGSGLDVHLDSVPSTAGCPFSPCAVLTLVQPASLDLSVSIAHLLHMSLGMVVKSSPTDDDAAAPMSTDILPVSPRVAFGKEFSLTIDSRGSALMVRTGCCSTLFFLVTFFNRAVVLNRIGGILGKASSQFLPFLSLLLSNPLLGDDAPQNNPGMPRLLSVTHDVGPPPVEPRALVSSQNHRTGEPESARNTPDFLLLEGFT